MTRLRTAERGFTIIEVVVATLVLTLGALATFGLLSSARKNTERAKATQVALDLAQQELEEMRYLTSEQRALIEPPQSSTNPLDPNYRVDTARGEFALTREPPGDYEQLVVNGTFHEEEPVSGGIVEPGPTPFSSGDVSGDIYRYVVWRNDDQCAGCEGEEDFKQIVVAVKLDKPGNQAAERGYVEVQSNFVDPTDAGANVPLPDSGGNVVTAQQFYLSDTPCDADGVTERQPIVVEEGDDGHPLHNTLGSCADGPQTKTTPGAPDALLLGPPPDPAPSDPNDPPLYDYATDFYLEPTPDTDKGVQIRLDETAGCHYEPTATANREMRVHRWVTDSFVSDFVLKDKVTLEFHTRALNDDPHEGKLCVYLFKRDEPGGGDTLLVDKESGNEYWTYYKSDWPRFSWANPKVAMTFEPAPDTIPAGDRLGVALSVESAETVGANALSIMYDHPKYPTRIEVDTTTPIGGP